MAKKIVKQQGPDKGILQKVTSFFEKKNAKTEEREISRQKNSNRSLTDVAKEWEGVTGLFRQYVTDNFPPGYPRPKEVLAIQQAASLETGEEFSRAMSDLSKTLSSETFKTVCTCGPLREFLSSPREDAIHDREAKLRVLFEYAPPRQEEVTLHRDLVLLGLDSLLPLHNISPQEGLLNGWLTTCKYSGSQHTDAESIWKKLKFHVENHPKEPLSERAMKNICLFMCQNMPTKEDLARCQFLVKTLGYQPFNEFDQLAKNLAWYGGGLGTYRTKQILDFFPPGALARSSTLILGKIAHDLTWLGCSRAPLPFVQTLFSMGGIFPKTRELEALTHFVKDKKSPENTEWLETLISNTALGKEALALAKKQAPDLPADEILSQVVLACKKGLQAPAPKEAPEKTSER